MNDKTEIIKRKSRRFFYHYYKQRNKMSVHFEGKCMLVDNVECHVFCESKWNKTQPYLVMRGFANKINIENNKAIIK